MLDIEIPREHDELALMSALGLTLREAKFLSILMRYSMPGDEDFPDGRTRQHIYALRRKLARYSVEILSCGKQYYSITTEDKNKLGRVINGGH